MISGVWGTLSPQISFPYPCSAENICTAMVK